MRRRRRGAGAGSRAGPGRLVDRGRPASRRAPGERNRAAGGQPTLPLSSTMAGLQPMRRPSWRSPARILRDVRQRHRPGHRPLRQLPLARGNACRHGEPAQRGRLRQPARSRPVGGRRRRRRARVRRSRLGRGREPAAVHRRRPVRRRDAGRGADAPRGGACAVARRGFTAWRRRDGGDDRGGPAGARRPFRLPVGRRFARLSAARSRAHQDHARPQPGAGPGREAAPSARPKPPIIRRPTSSRAPSAPTSTCSSWRSAPASCWPATGCCCAATA